MDAHPSKQEIRPEISDLVDGREIHFVCLTHPHSDHGIDLIPILEKHPNVQEFWSTIYDIPALIYGAEQTVNFPSSVRKYAAKMNQDWGSFFIDIIGAVMTRDIERHVLRSDQQAIVIDGVEIHCISPDEKIQNSFFDAYKEKLNNPKFKVPDPNTISAILCLKYGKSVVILGADALRKNWESAIPNFHKRRLPKACLLKVPHHGARNAYHFRKRSKNYLDLCSNNPRANSVLFAGDCKHPDRKVYDLLQKKTEVYCLSNGLRPNNKDSNPLGLHIPGAQAVEPASICNPSVSFEIMDDGNISVISGKGCNKCSL